MSKAIGKRKRARKACIPCHKRKRKCDGEYPCGMCTTYEYNCCYADDNTTTKHLTLGDRDSVTTSHAATASSPDSQIRTRETDGSSVTSPAVVSASENTPAGVGVFDEHKSRYAGASAAMAFPHILGVALGFDSPPKNLHSVAYNFGIRPEEASTTHGSLGNLISLDNLELFSGVYFSEMAPIGDYLDPKIYYQRCRDYYRGSGNSTVIFGAVAAGVAALGSFLSTRRHDRESELVQYAKTILDDPASIRMLGIDHVIAWALRVFYLRATSRPNNAWIASCTAMHLMEAVGLHEDENIQKMASVPGAAAMGHDADRLRRVFWISWAGHNMLTYEYDRSSIRFRAVTCKAITPKAGSVADKFAQIAQIIPAPNSPFHLDCEPTTPRDELFERLKALDKLDLTHPFLVVTRADLAFCFYRRIYQLKMGISDEIITLIVDIGNAAIAAAEKLAKQGRLFWNVIGSVFHYACVLLAIDTPASSVHIPAAINGLENLVKAADTGPTREALSMARHLLSHYTAKKRKELALLEAIEAGYQSGPAELETNGAVQDMGWELDWDQFLIEPYLSMLGPVVQL